MMSSAVQTATVADLMIPCVLCILLCSRCIEFVAGVLALSGLAAGIRSAAQCLKSHRLKKVKHHRASWTQAGPAHPRCKSSKRAVDEITQAASASSSTQASQVRSR